MNIEKLTPTAGWSLVEIDDSNEYLKLSSGHKIYIDTTFEPQRRAQTKGTIVKICNAVFFDKEDRNSHPYKVEVEAKPGDLVVFHFLCVQTALNDGRVFMKDGRKFVFLPYEELFFSLRNGEVIPLNGWIFVEPDVEEIKSSIIDLSFTKKKSVTHGTVRFAGAMVDEYKDVPWSDHPIDVGERVIFKDIEAIPIQDDVHAVLKGMYRMHRIDAYVVDENLQIR